MHNVWPDDLESDLLEPRVWGEEDYYEDMDSMDFDDGQPDELTEWMDFDPDC